MEETKTMLIDAIYNHLYESFPQYNHITYAAPAKNHIEVNHWFFQTPNIWGYNSDDYKKSFLPTASYQLDKDYFVPTCQQDSDCSGVSKCQSPNFAQNKKLCLTNAFDFVENVYTAIVSAEKSVDIVTLTDSTGFAINKAFIPVLKNAFHTLAEKTKQLNYPIQIRILAGVYLPDCTVNKSKILAKFCPKTTESNDTNTNNLKIALETLTRDLPKDNQLTISITNERSCAADPNCNRASNQTLVNLPVLDGLLTFSWNHGKTITIDNQKLITGGQNLWGADYLESDPVHDLNVQMIGPVAQGATIYANKIWQYVRKNPQPKAFGLQMFFANLCYTYHGQTGIITPVEDPSSGGNIPLISPNDCGADIDPYDAPNLNLELPNTSVRAMYISRLDRGIDVGKTADQSEVARVFAFKHAQKSIKIAQQALYKKIPLMQTPLAPLNSIDGNVIEAIAEAIRLRNVDTYIITSSEHTGGGYNSNVPLSYIRSQFEEILVKQGLNANEAKQKLDQFLHLAYISYTNQKENIKSHYKFWMVDDETFYIGSHNIYPFGLQEFGVIIDDANASKQVLDTYWNPMWKYAYIPNTNNFGL